MPTATNTHKPPMFSLALVGSGRTWDIFATIFCHERFEEAYPWATIVGRVAGIKEQATPAEQACDTIQEYSDCAALFAAHPDITIICDFSDDGSCMDEIRKHAPLTATIVQSQVVSAVAKAASAGSFSIDGEARLRQAREVFTTLIDQVEEEILVLDTTGHVVDINRSALLHKGGSKNEYIGKLCHEVETIQFCNDTENCLYKEVLRTGKSVTKMYNRVTPDGRVQYFRVRAFLVMDRDNTPWRIVLMRNNSTTQVHIEQRLQQTEKLAVVGELSTYIAHEIRNPLFAIGGFANSLLRTPSLDEAAQGKVRVILEESRRLDEILKSFINFARPIDQVVEEVDINKIARQALSLLNIGDTRLPIETTINLDENLPKVRGNPEMLTQCLINLLKNSHEALPYGGRIDIRSYMKDERVVVEVMDNGTGIPPDLQEKVFSPFFSTKDKGAGLGLAMTRKIVEELGGAVLLTSQVHDGTTVTILLKPALAI